MAWGVHVSSYSLQVELLYLALSVLLVLLHCAFDFEEDACCCSCGFLQLLITYCASHKHHETISHKYLQFYLKNNYNNSNLPVGFCLSLPFYSSILFFLFQVVMACGHIGNLFILIPYGILRCYLSIPGFHVSHQKNIYWSSPFQATAVELPSTNDTFEQLSQKQALVNLWWY